MEKTKKFRFNLIDFLITVIIIVVIAFIAYIFFFSGKASASSSSVKIQYTLEVKNERDELVDNAAANIGKTLVEGTAKYHLGEVVDFYSESATYSTSLAADGSSAVSEYPEHSNVYFIVNAEASKPSADSRYSINGFELSVGTLVYVRLPEYAGTAYCVQVKEIQ